MYFTVYDKSGDVLCLVRKEKIPALGVAAPS